MPRNATDPLVRWFDHVAPAITPPNTCWWWTGAKTRRGYGFFHYDGKQGKAHRFAYETFVGPIPTGMQIDHLCRNPSCVRPDHLEAVTGRENLMRSESFVAQNARKTTCPIGHPYSGVNSQGRRVCHTCARDWMRQRRSSKKAA